MKTVWQKYKWIAATIFGSAVFSAGFAFFLQPNDLSPGGISGLAMVAVELLGFGTTGIFSILINLPLFLLGGLKIGKRFFVGSLIGMMLSSVLIDAFDRIPMATTEPLIGVIYGGIMLIFDFKRPAWKPGLVLFIAWLISFFVLMAWILAQVAEWLPTII